MLPEETRRELNDGNEITLVPGLGRLRTECLEALDYDTVIVFDTHWESTFEHIVTAHDRREGKFTSTSCPAACGRCPTTCPATRSWRTSSPPRPRAVTLDPRDRRPVPAHPLRHRQPVALPGRGLGKRWVSVSTAQTGDTEDFLRAGRAIGAAIGRPDRRSCCSRPGRCRTRSGRCASCARTRAPPRTSNRRGRAADLERIAWLEAGDHARVIATMPESDGAPEASFGHYLMMVAALGGDADRAGACVQHYENSVGTGQMHLWFDRHREAGAHG